MLKSGCISFFILIIFVVAIYFEVFKWFASSYAFIIGIISLVIALGAAFLILGNPLKKK